MVLPVLPEHCFVSAFSWLFSFLFYKNFFFFQGFNSEGWGFEKKEILKRKCLVYSVIFYCSYMKLQIYIQIHMFLLIMSKRGRKNARKVITILDFNFFLFCFLLFCWHCWRWTFMNNMNIVKRISSMRTPRSEKTFTFYVAIFTDWEKWHFIWGSRRVFLFLSLLFLHFLFSS